MSMFFFFCFFFFGVKTGYFSLEVSICDRADQKQVFLAEPGCFPQPNQRVMTREK